MGSVVRDEADERRGDRRLGRGGAGALSESTVRHFADVLASREYQDVNRRYRVGSLRDTCILCTSEVGVEEMRGGRAML